LEFIGLLPRGYPNTHRGAIFLKTQRLIEPKRLKGFRDYTPALMAQRQRVIAAVRRGARLAGFQEIGTPALEYAEVLLGQGGDETDKEVYRFVDHGERAVALRFDLTVPFARYVAEHQGEMVFPFKRLQIGDVWRGENTQKGRYREFCQCDLDIIGVESAAADIEVLICLMETIAEVAATPFTMAVGHRSILSAVIRQALPTAMAADAAQTAETAVLIAIDKLAKIGRDGVAKVLAALPGVEATEVAALLDIVTARTAAGDSDLGVVRRLLSGDAPALAAIDRLEETVATVRSCGGSGSDAGKIRIDLAIARGLGYYTGLVFETTLDQLPGFGSVSSGGRYDGLVSRFSSRSLGGVGGSIGLDRLVAGLEELGLATPEKTSTVFIAVATDDARRYAFTLAQALRRSGQACDIGMTAGKLGNQFKYADRCGYPLVLTVGSDEMQSQTFSMKHMAAGTEERGLAAAGLVAAVLKALT